MAENQSYDYIICGGGTSGCTVAGRLAEDPSISVLVIEAGAHSNEVPATEMPGGWISLFTGDQDWKILDEPADGLGGRQTPLFRGKVLGGSSTMNGTMQIPGPLTDFDTLGLNGWSGEDMQRYTAKAETFHGGSWFTADDSTRGKSGPIRTAPHPTTPLGDRMLESFVLKGIPHEPGFLSNGDYATAASYCVSTANEGMSSTASAYISNDNLRTNVTILTNTTVDKVGVQQKGDVLTASTVDVVLADGTRTTYTANHEIILSGGAYCTPPMPLRSGIGPAEELARHKIHQMLDLPVGENLQDHVIVFNGFEVSEPGLTSDEHFWHKDSLQKSIMEWHASKTGFMADYPFGPVAWTRLDDRLQDSELWTKAPRKSGCDPMGLDPKTQPNVEIVSTNCFIYPRHLADGPPIPPVDGSWAISALTLFFGPQSRGDVRLRSTDPKDNPQVQHNYLSNDLDALVLGEGCRLAQEILLEGEGTKDVIKGPWPRDSKRHNMRSREEWIQIARDSAVPGYHPVGTCAMGKADDKKAVVDEQLRVRGVEGLRVVDVSVVPTLYCAHTQLTAYGIGEKAAEMIKADYKKTKVNGHL